LTLQRALLSFLWFFAIHLKFYVIFLIRKFQRILPTEKYSDCGHFIQWVDELFRNALKDSGVDKSKLTGVGMAISGNVDAGEGVIVSGGNFGMMYGENISLQVFSKRWNVGVYAVTTMGGAAAAEFRFGKHAGSFNIVTIGLGVGIGSGVVNNGQLLISHPRRPIGYIGHMLIPGNTNRCTCGFRGCLEAYSGGEYLKKIVQKELPHRTELQDALLLDRAAAAGDPDAVRIMSTAAEYNAVGIAGMVQLYAPDAMIFSGGQSRADGFLFNTTLEKLRQILPEERRDFDISITTLGEFQSALGAARLAYEQFF
jgi:glucokinase